MTSPAFDLIGLTQLRNNSVFAGIDGSGMTVAVIDTGLDHTHSLLDDNYITGKDFVYGDDEPEDGEGHGTHVAGIIGAEDPNIGVAPDVKLIGLKVFDDNGGSATNTDIEAALQWVIDNKDRYNIVAVNMSLGSGFYTSPSEASGDITIDQVKRLEELGVVVVSAAGNSYKDHEYQNFGGPAIFSTLSVGAVWQDGVNDDVAWASGSIDYTTGADRITSFSQRLVAPNTIFAPGALITSTAPGGGFQQMAGTSQASPVVAGAVALMQEAATKFGGRLLSPSEIVDIIRSTADTIFDGDNEDDNVDNTQTSYPRLNIYKAVQEIQRRFGQTAPSGDPNGSIQGAYIGPILDGTTAINPILGSIGIDGGTTNVGNKDVDIFKFEVRSRGTITIKLGSNSSSPADFDTLLRLFNTSGQELAFNNDSGSSKFSTITATLDPGVYYVGVSGNNNRNYNPNVAASGVAGQTGNYSLQFQLSNSDPNGILSGAVPVNLGTDLEPLFFNGILGSDPIENSDQRINIGAADVDIFKVVAPDNGILLIDVDTPYQNGFVDSLLRVFDTSGNQLFVNDDAQSFDSSLNYTEFTDSRYPNLIFEDPSDRTYYQGHTSDSFIGLEVERGETLYIGISDYENSSYNPNNLNGRSASGTGGKFDLTVQFFNKDQNGSITQALDSSVRPLPSTKAAGFIGGDSNFNTGEFIEVGDRDVDFIKINSPTAGILEIDIDSYDDPSISDPVDTVVFIYNQQGKLLASNDDTDSSVDPLLRYQIAANTDYFVAVAGYGNDSFNPFQLGSGSSGDTGEYKFSSRLLPLSQANSLSNNKSTGGSVQNLSLGTTVFGNIGDDNGFVIGASDIDIYRFTSTVSGKVTIRVNTNEEFSADTFLRVFNAQGTEIAYNNNENSLTRGSAVELSVTAGTQYLIGVNGASSQARSYNPITGTGAANGSQGNYSISIDSNSNSSTSRWQINGTGDFNKDGNQDILWHNASTNQNGAWLMNSGGANIGWQGMAGNPTGWEINGTGDFNKDGNQDILWHNASTNQNGAWLMNSGGANIGWQGMAGNPTGWEINGTGDFNKDGNQDILWHNNSTNQNGAWLMNSGGANIGWQGMAGNPAGWNINGTGDFNKDGNQDILWHNNSTNQNGAWLMNSGGANIGWQGMAGNPAGWNINGTGDFNKDGNRDILWHNNSTNQNGAWLMNSGGANIGWQGMSPNP
ncbi:S8 family serine peptidase [Nostoc sp. C117]|uniref:S8 family serine peptidase n=1 Tax=Nostoc sp. C117 TaxID=3349875 RepID=UPI00370D7FAA